MRVDILGITVDPYSMQETVERIRRAVEGRVRMRVITANPEIIYASERDDKLKKIIATADIITADGIGVVWAAQWLGARELERVTGIDLVQALFPIAHEGKWRIFFLGGKPGVAEQAANQVVMKNQGITCATMHGYFSPEEEIKVLEKIRHFQPDLLLVGLGAPFQEYWIAEHPGLATVSIGVGGSFDVLAGITARAPRSIQDCHLEWLYRLWKEPWRWKRQVVLPRFVIKVLWQRFKNKTL
ncbi:MAG: WecB/TagA/CpsF family glycosyltransferase [Desulfosporosinus sp.]|jgi:N-acetylglucosaminyldiphosphoundecaprenol N-acetyl-beta-D-mannosaminyltransferase